MCKLCQFPLEVDVPAVQASIQQADVSAVVKNMFVVRTRRALSRPLGCAEG